ncbi:MAG: hypothetical protein QGF20_08410, partial [Alphaproteobacteria bacterium]|jgi:hypothetical protein|nr:hypothetical protein [Alphaproteobacteria bacterium]
MGRTIRRVVTGHDEMGVATVIMDGAAECVLQRPNRPGVTLTNLWQVDRTPALMESHDDPVAGPLILHPPKNGSVFRIVQFDPEDPDELARAHSPRWGPAPTWSRAHAIRSCTALIVSTMPWF